MKMDEKLMGLLNNTELLNQLLKLADTDDIQKMLAARGINVSDEDVEAIRKKIGALAGANLGSALMGFLGGFKK